jgi:hypothetical protein
MGPKLELGLDPKIPPQITLKIEHLKFFSHEKVFREFFQNFFNVGLMGNFAHFFKTTKPVNFGKIERRFRNFMS